MRIRQPAKPVPTYALYGEPGAQPDSEALHCETIEARSRLHDFEIRPHRHEDLFQLLFLSGGAGEVVCDGTAAPLIPPCVVLMPALVVHAYSFTNTVRGLVITLYERHLASLLGDMPAPSGARILPLEPADARRVGGALTILAAEFAGRAPGRVAMMTAQLSAALLHVARALSQTTTAADPGPGGRLALRFRKMIDQEFARPFDTAVCAARLGVTPTHLRRLCRRHLGVTPLGAVHARRVLEAKRALVFTSMGVKEVAAATGFDDHAYFSRFFARATGLSPTAFRATQRTTPRMVTAPPAPGDTPPAPSRSRA